MDDELLVQVGNALHNLPKEPLGQFLRVVALWLRGDLVEYLLALNEVHHDMDLFSKLIEEVVPGLDDVLVREFARNLVFFLMGESPLLVRFTGNLDSERLFLLGVLLFVAFVDRSMRTFAEHLPWFIEDVARVEAFGICLFLALGETIGLSMDKVKLAAG